MQINSNVKSSSIGSNSNDNNSNHDGKDEDWWEDCPEEMEF